MNGKEARKRDLYWEGSLLYYWNYEQTELSNNLIVMKFLYSLLQWVIIYANLVIM